MSWNNVTPVEILMKEKEKMKPTIGRIVHYTNLGDKDGKYPPEQQAAVITRVRDNEGSTVALHIFYPTGQFDMDNVPYSEQYERGHWSWPPQIKEINETE